MKSLEDYLQPAFEQFRAEVWNAAYDVIEEELHSSGNTGKSLKMADAIVEKIFGVVSVIDSNQNDSGDIT